MREYEVMYIINASVEDEKRKELIESLGDIITNGNGKIIKTDEWGMREFAYEIEHMKKGYYVVVTFTADNECVHEFDRLMHINPNIVRYMIINKEEELKKLAKKKESK